MALMRINKVLLHFFLKDNEVIFHSQYARLYLSAPNILRPSKGVGLEVMDKYIQQLLR